MNESETRKILNRIYVVYPHSFKDWTDDQRKAYCIVWNECFLNMPYSIVLKAVTNFISNDDSDFAPKPGQIKQVLIEMISPDTELESIKAWESLRRYIRRRTGESDIDRLEYNKLDWITKRIYSMEDLRSMSMMDSDKIEYRRSEFQRLYKTLKDRKDSEDIESGDLVSLAGGKERFLSLGFSTQEFAQIGGGNNGGK